MSDFSSSDPGWMRDLPDHRDYHPLHETVEPLLQKWKRAKSRSEPLPAGVDWSCFFPSAGTLKGLPISSACAILSLVEYFERRATGRVVAGSPPFLHRMASELLQWDRRSGVPLRACCRALTRFGSPALKFYSWEKFHSEQAPPGFLFSHATEYRDVIYFRLDPQGKSADEVLCSLRRFLASGWVVAFGLSLFDSLDIGPEIPFPSLVDGGLGGQAVVAVGYNDLIGTRSGRGAIRIRAAWGREWGESGCGWLPYSYVLEGLAADFWTFLRPSWQSECDLAAWL